jgi:hypothetical protein
MQKIFESGENKIFFSDAVTDKRTMGFLKILFGGDAH